LAVGACLFLLFALLKVAGLVGRPTRAPKVPVTEMVTDTPQATATPSVVAPERATQTSLEPIATPSAVDRAIAAPHSSAAPPAVVTPQAKPTHAPLKPGSNATSNLPSRAPETRDSK